MTALDLVPADPAEVGMDADRLRFADALMQRQFDDGRSPILTALVARHGRVVFSKVLGDQRPGGPPATLDAIFPFASNAKCMTAATVLALAELGKIGISTPIRRYLPELDEDEHGDVIVHHLLTHTSGWTAEVVDARMAALVEAGDFVSDIGLDPIEHLFITSVLTSPRTHRAGELMSYLNANYSLLGEIVRRVTGGTFDAAARRYVFDPCGMSDTSVIVPEALVPRVIERPPGIPGAPGHPDTRLAMYDPLWLALDDGGGGVHGTAVDHLRFYEMVRNDGLVGDARVLSRASVATMTSDRIPGVPAEIGDIRLPEAHWSYGFGVGSQVPLTRYRGGTSPRGTLRHGGSGGIFGWVDRASGVSAVYFELLTEQSADGLPISWAAERFEDIITSAIVD